MLNKENMSKYLPNTGKQTSIHEEPVVHYDSSSENHAYFSELRDSMQLNPLKCIQHTHPYLDWASALHLQHHLHWWSLSQHVWYSLTSLDSYTQLRKEVTTCLKKWGKCLLVSLNVTEGEAQGSCHVSRCYQTVECVCAQNALKVPGVPASVWGVWGVRWFWWGRTTLVRSMPQTGKKVARFATHWRQVGFTVFQFQFSNLLSCRRAIHLQMENPPF